MTYRNRINKYDMMFMNVVTPLHNGSGEGLGMVDNPIMREKTTQYPVIQASSIKGVLRDEYDRNNHPDVDILFGPSPKNGEEHAGAISFGDGQLFAFPVRSVRGCFVWITSRLILCRFYQNVCLMNFDDKFKKELGDCIKKIIIRSENAKICLSGINDICHTTNNRKLLLEEYSIPFEVSSALGELADELGEIIFKNECLFSWSKIIGDNNIIPKKFLIQNYNIDWLEAAKKEVINSDKTVKIFNNNNDDHLLLKLNDENTKVNLTINGYRYDEFIVKVENSEVNIYKKDSYNFLREEFTNKLVLLDDDIFTYFIMNSTEIIPNISIDENGTTREGSLRYTEYLPSETIIYSTLIFDKSRKERKKCNALEVKKRFVDCEIFPQTIQIGGYETTGKGIVKLTLVGE